MEMEIIPSSISDSISELSNIWKFNDTELRHVSTAINKERWDRPYIFDQPIDLKDEKVISDISSKIEQTFKKCQNVELKVVAYPKSNTMLLNRI